MLFQVSPPLVGFKESVLAGGEAHEGVVIKPAKVVEAATPSGACVVRVKAHALPNRTAALLDEHAHLLPDLVGHRDSRQQYPRQSRSVNVKGQRHSMDGSDSSRELHKLRDAYAASLSAAGNKQLVRLLERAWLLGPRHVGPNIALCSPATAPVGSAAASSLFDVPPAAVIKAAIKHGPLARIAGAAAGVQHQPESAVTNGPGAADAQPGITDAADAAASSEAEAQQQLDVVFGRPITAAALKQLPSESVVTDAADTATVAAAQAAETAAAVGVGELWPHITSSVESGVTAGFQLAAGAGPLCDESMWGVVFEIEVRLVLPSSGGAGELDLAEAVYGPFSGQVSQYRWAA